MNAFVEYFKDALTEGTIIQDPFEEAIERAASKEQKKASAKKAWIERVEKERHRRSVTIHRHVERMARVCKR